MPNSSGDCYEANGRYVLNNTLFGDDDSLVLCHGAPILQTDGKPFGHCWIEKGNMVLDFSNGRNIKIDKNIYYIIGKIPAPGYKKIYKYTFKEMQKKIASTGHWGPWDLKPPR